MRALQYYAYMLLFGHVIAIYTCNTWSPMMQLHETAMHATSEANLQAAMPLEELPKLLLRFLGHQELFALGHQGGRPLDVALQLQHRDPYELML